MVGEKEDHTTGSIPGIFLTIIIIKPQIIKFMICPTIKLKNFIKFYLRFDYHYGSKNSGMELVV